MAGLPSPVMGEPPCPSKRTGIAPVPYHVWAVRASAATWRAGAAPPQVTSRRASPRLCAHLLPVSTQALIGCQSSLCCPAGYHHLGAACPRTPDWGGSRLLIKPKVSRGMAPAPATIDGDDGDVRAPLCTPTVRKNELVSVPPIEMAHPSRLASARKTPAEFAETGVQAARQRPKRHAPTCRVMKRSLAIFWGGLICPRPPGSETFVGMKRFNRAPGDNRPQ
jgi:hypothetical protein